MTTTGYSIELEQMSKSYSKKTQVINKMNLSVVPGEFLVLLGPSGCGKSTTLRIIAGLEAPTGGKVLIDGKDSAQLSSTQRSIAMVFQDYALYPNMTVYQNLEYALRVHKVPKQIRQQRLAKILASLNLTNYKDRFPAQLSGGQKQRVALGRGMAKKSKIFLLDEPLSNIDVQLREKARDEIQRLHAENGQTIIYVTHDQQEAMALGDRIAVINDGKIQMIDTPANLYHNPANLFVAQFVGTPQINVFKVNYFNHQLIEENGTVVANLANYQAAGLVEDTDYLLGIRPENVAVSLKAANTDFPAEVESVVDYGRYQQVTLRAFDRLELKAVVSDWPVGTTRNVYVKLSRENLLLFDDQTHERLDANPEARFVLKGGQRRKVEA
ncbi:sugar ABC transporter ATP-binding protein [Lentilactobacillus fungorum]|uniref:Sugar ABC transporter ATP-binding protein n=1 Tax=Lentilactobacillus fungorum TaxID=2201250 RepID=A0ABQ3W128_9LACO|nr:ABC transporter ATP-binding protein [Lentilactobacillus fungorum]GHP14885.1 sugar ABC transporter ATP-binding protein [Lentilactobacillus fungorum]